MMSDPQPPIEPTDTPVLSEETSQRKVRVGMYGLGVDPNFLRDAFGRDVLSRGILELPGFISVRAEPGEVSKYAPHLEGQVQGPYPALVYTGEKDDSTFVYEVDLEPDEVQAWAEFNFGPEGGMYNYETIEVPIDADLEVYDRVLLETVPEGVGVRVFEDERDNLVKDQEVRDDLAAEVRRNLRRIRGEEPMDTVPTVEEGSSQFYGNPERR
jgi:hypothetical protein